jgi:hypothetical protein
VVIASKHYFCCPSQPVNESRIVVDYSDFVGAAQPEEIRKALAANAEQLASAGHAHGSGDLSSMRYASYKGHQIAVRTASGGARAGILGRYGAKPVRHSALEPVLSRLP